ncbi:MAG: hypothetical protein ACRDOX_01065 [Nocardioides sp.]
MSHSIMSRLAGSFALSAGVLIVGAQLVMLPFDPKDHVATTTAPAFQLGGAAYFVGFVMLMLFLVADHDRLEERTGRLGVAATIVAVVGTMALGGDLWFETFAVPWLADEAPNAFDTDPTVVLGLGAVSSYLLFAIGWMLYGVANVRARAPVTISVAIIIGGALGYRALLSPWAVPLALSVCALGVWLIRTSPARTRRATGPGRPEPVIP